MRQDYSLLDINPVFPSLGGFYYYYYCYFIYFFLLEYHGEILNSVLSACCVLWICQSLAFGDNSHHEYTSRIGQNLEVSSAVYINMYLANIHYLINILQIISFIVFRVMFSSWFRSHAGGRTFKLETHQEMLFNSWKVWIWKQNAL